MKTRFASALALSAVAAVGGTMLLAASAPSPAVAAPMADGGFTIDPVHSTIVYKIKHKEVSWFLGRFNDPSGTFNINLADPSKSIVDVSISVDKVDTGNKKRDDHLKSVTFFSAKEYPTITLKGKSFKKSGEHAVEMTGELTLHGQTKPITITVENTGEKGPLGGAASTFTIKRSDFGMTEMIGPVGDEVTIMVGLEGSR